MSLLLGSAVCLWGSLSCVPWRDDGLGEKGVVCAVLGDPGLGVTGCVLCGTDPAWGVGMRKLTICFAWGLGIACGSVVLG